MKSTKPVGLLIIIMIIGLILVVSFSAIEIMKLKNTKEYKETNGIFVRADFA